MRRVYLLLAAGLCLCLGMWGMKSARKKDAEVPVVSKTEKQEESDAVQDTKKIALTFDDGPHPVYTEQMLNLLEEMEVPATFFLLGQNVEKQGELVKEIAQKGHLIGNHTYHHVQITTLTTEQAYEEIDKTSALIEDRKRNRVCQAAFWYMESGVRSGS